MIKHSSNSSTISTRFFYLLYAMLVLLILFLCVRNVCVKIFWPYPLEFRDAAALDAAIGISKGFNIYSLETFPQYFYVYGGLTPLLLSVFFRFVTPSLRIAYCLNVLFFFLILLLISIILWEKIKKRTILFLSLSMIYTNLWVWFSENSHSKVELAGLFFMLLSVYLADKSNYSLPGLILSWLCSAIALHFKQYYLVCFGAVCVDLFLYVSKRKAICMLGLGCLGFALSYAIITFFFPLYINLTIFHHINDTTDYIFSHMLKQVIANLAVYWLPFTILGTYSYKSFPNNCIQIKSFFNPVFRQVFKPLAKKRFFDIYSISFFVSFICFVFKLGGHNGSMNYFNTMCLPFLLISASLLLEDIVNSETFIQFCFIFLALNGFTAVVSLIFKYYAAFLPKTLWISETFLVDGLLAVIIILLLYLSGKITNRTLTLSFLLFFLFISNLESLLHFPGITKPMNIEQNDYTAFNERLRQCQSIYLSPTDYPFAMHNSNVTTYDNGHTQYINSIKTPFSGNLLGIDFTEQNQKIETKYNDYFERIRNNIQNKEYDCMVISGLDYVDLCGFMSEDYVVEDLGLQVPFQLYVPK